MKRPKGVKSVRRQRNLLQEFTACLEENPFDDDDDPLISVPTDFYFEFKRESEEEWLLDGEDILKTIYAYQNASVRDLRQRTAIHENIEKMLSLSSIILLRDQSTIFDGSSDRSQLREAIKSQQLSVTTATLNCVFSSSQDRKRLCPLTHRHNQVINFCQPLLTFVNLCQPLSTFVDPIFSPLFFFH